MEKPFVDPPASDAPTELVMIDLVEGSGPVATKGNQVEVHYVGVSWSTGEQFDASWDRRETFRFSLGAGQVIQGWDQGVQGMKVGGQRRLEIPAHLGYGDRGAPPVIRGGETLIFIVDLISVR